CRTLWHALGRLVPAGVAKWQTRQSQKLLGGDPRAGSTPASGTRWTKVGNAEWCNGNTGAFGASIPGSNPGSAARIIAESFLDSSTVKQAAVNRKVVGSNPTRGALGSGPRDQTKVRPRSRPQSIDELPSIRHALLRRRETRLLHREHRSRRRAGAHHARQAMLRLAV